MGTIFTLLNFFVVDLKHEITTYHFKEDVWWIFQDIKESVYIAISKKLKMNQNAHFIVFYYNKNKFSDYPKNIKINIALYWYLVRQYDNYDFSLEKKNWFKVLMLHISSNYFGCSILTCTWLFMHLLTTQHIYFKVLYKRKPIAANLKITCIEILTLGNQNGIFFVLLKIIIKNLLKQSVRRTRQTDEVKRQIWFLLCLCE